MILRKSTLTVTHVLIYHHDWVRVAHFSANHERWVAQGLNFQTWETSEPGVGESENPRGSAGR